MPININEVLNKSKKDKKKVVDFTFKLGSNIAPKVKPKDEEEGFFWKVLDLLSRGQYVSANTVENILEGDFSNIPTDISKGLSGEKKGSYIDLAQKYLPENIPNWAKVGVGFIGDVLLDPTTYVGIGSLTKAGQTAKATGKLAKAGDIASDIGKLTTQAKKGQRALLTFGGKTLVTGEKVLDVIDKVSDAIKSTEVAKDVTKLFKRTTGIPELDDMVDKYLTKRGYLESKAYKFGNIIKKEMQQVAKETGTNIDDLVKNVNNLMEVPEKTQELVPGLKKVADTLANKYDELITAEKNVGYQIQTLKESAEQARNKLKYIEDNFDELKKTNATADYNAIRKKYKKILKGSAKEIRVIINKHKKDMKAMGKRVLDVNPIFDRVVEAKKYMKRSVPKTFFKDLDIGDLNVPLVYRSKSGANDAETFLREMAERYSDLIDIENPDTIIDVMLTPIKEWKERLTTDLTDYSLIENAEKKLGEIKTIQNYVNGLFKNLKLKKEDLIKVIKETAKNPDDILFSKSKIKSNVAKLRNKQLELAKDANKVTGYVPRVIDPIVAEKYLKKQFKGNSKVWNTKLGNSLKRKTGNMTLEEVNQAILDSGIKGLELDDLQKFFIEDPAYIATHRSLASAKATTSAGFLNEVTEQFGKSKETLTKEIAEDLGMPLEEVTKEMFEKATKGLDVLPESITKRLPQLKGKYFEPEVLAEVNKTFEKFFDPKAPKAVFKVFDNIQNWWKAWTLSVFPSYHIRNAVSNVFLNYLGDVKDPRDYARAFAMQAYKKTGNNKFIDFLGLSKDMADDLLEEMNKLGVIGEGMYNVEIPQVIISKLDEVKDIKGFMKMIGKQFTAEGKAIKTGRELGSLIEDNARIAHYINKRRKGFVPGEAAKEVKKYLFDYSDLSQFERDVMKRIAPFYTFLRKNLPLQVEKLITEPGKAGKVMKIKKGVEEIAGTSDIKLPFLSEYIKEASPIKVRSREDGNIDILLMENWIPVSDITKLTEPITTAVAMMSPIFKAPIENWANFNTFFKDNIEKFPGEKDNFLGIDVRKRAVLNPAKLYDIISERGLSEGAKAFFGKDILRNFRLLNEIDKLNPWNVFGVNRPHKVDPEQMQRWLQLFIGKLQKYDKKKAYNYYEYRVRKELGKLKGSLNKAKRENNKSEQLDVERQINNLKEQLRIAKKEATSGKIIKAES